MATETTEVKEEKLSFIMDDEEFLTRKGAMKEMKIGATTLAKEIKCGNIVPYDLPHGSGDGDGYGYGYGSGYGDGYGFSKASVREWMNNRKKKFLAKLRAKK